MTTIETINQEINLELGNEQVQKALIATTFKGLTPLAMRKALMEGMMRGFKFKDFLEKNVYAIPFKDGYSLITSVDYARKVGMRSGVCGKSAPTYESDGKKIISCSITIKRKVGETIGEYSATVFFDEYNTGKNQWLTKPRTMIAKVAEMHALRMACPEELAQSYVEEEMEKEIQDVPNVDISVYEERLSKVTSLEDLKNAWSSIPVEAKKALETLKETMKSKYDNA